MILKLDFCTKQHIERGLLLNRWVLQAIADGVLVNHLLFPFCGPKLYFKDKIILFVCRYKEIRNTPSWSINISVTIEKDDFLLQITRLTAQSFKPSKRAELQSNYRKSLGNGADFAPLMGILKLPTQSAKVDIGKLVVGVYWGCGQGGQFRAFRESSLGREGWILVVTISGRSLSALSQPTLPSFSPKYSQLSFASVRF